MVKVGKFIYNKMTVKVGNFTKIIVLIIKVVGGRSCYKSVK